MSLTKCQVSCGFLGESQKDRKYILPMQNDRKKITNQLQLGLFFAEKFSRRPCSEAGTHDDAHEQCLVFMLDLIE